MNDLNFMRLITYTNFEQLPIDERKSARQQITIVVPSFVKELRERCFCNCPGIESVIFEETFHLRNIGISAFEKTSLRWMCIPDTVLAIPDSCFCDLLTLENIAWSNSVDRRKGVFWMQEA